MNYYLREKSQGNRSNYEGNIIVDYSRNIGESSMLVMESTKTLAKVPKYNLSSI